MTRLPPISTRTDTLCPSTTLFRSDRDIIGLLGGQILDHIGKGAVGMLVNIAKPPERAQRRPEIRDLVADPSEQRSEEHTSELQSLMRISYAVLCLKKKNQNTNIP